MRDQIIAATVQAFFADRSPRFFNTERGYQGSFYCSLRAALDRQGLLFDDRIVEMEYQKREPQHGLKQRPDIVFHIPSEVSGSLVGQNNYAVWAFKREANQEAAQKDFAKLDEMFETLNYPLGFFINIGSECHHLTSYEGSFSERLVVFAVSPVGNGVQLKRAHYSEGQLLEEDVPEEGR